jgi:protein phosphatase
VEADDIYLLCSDGLTDMVEPPVVHSILAGNRRDLTAATRALVELANRNGGRDNISVILLRIPVDFSPQSGWVQRWLAKKSA